MKPRRPGLESDDGLDWPQQKQPCSEGIRKSVIRSLPDFVFRCVQPSAVENGNRPCPARRGALDLHREARHHEAGRWQLLEIVQLFDVAIADMAAGLVAFPDQA